MQRRETVGAVRSRSRGRWPSRPSLAAALDSDPCARRLPAGNNRRTSPTSNAAQRPKPGSVASSRPSRCRAGSGAEKEYHALAAPITHAKGWSTASAWSRRWQASTLWRPAGRSSALDPQRRGQRPCGQHAVHARQQPHRCDRRPMQNAGPAGGTGRLNAKLSARETEDSSQEEIRR